MSSVKMYNHFQIADLRFDCIDKKKFYSMSFIFHRLLQLFLEKSV